MHVHACIVSARAVATRGADDLLVKQLFDNAPTELDVTIFDVDDELSMGMAREVAATAHKEKKFTDTVLLCTSLP